MCGARVARGCPACHVASAVCLLLPTAHQSAHVFRRYDKRDYHGSPVVYHGMRLLNIESNLGLHTALAEYTRNVLDALDIRNGAMHSEVMATPRESACPTSPLSPLLPSAHVFPPLPLFPLLPSRCR